MNRIIKSIENKYLVLSLDLVEDVFTKQCDAEEGALKNIKGTLDYSFYETLR